MLQESSHKKRQKSPRRRLANIRRGPIAPVLGEWAVLDTIHESHYTQISRAVPLRAGEDLELEYLVKSLRSDNSNRRLGRHLLKREMEILDGLDHPHVITVLDASDENGKPYFVMPNVGRLTLNDWVRRRNQIPLVDILWAIRQAAEGLNYLHEVGLCHLDVKPENVVVGDSGHVTIIDLGFAQSIGKHPSSAPFVGSRMYVAPERLRLRHVVTPAADVYSLGLILLDLLAGQHGKQSLDTEEKPIEDLPRGRQREFRKRSIKISYPLLSYQWIEFIERMSAGIPERRPTSNEVVETLRRMELQLFQI